MTDNKRLSPGVTILYGLPGAGKSYLLAALADEYINAGYPVCCNYPIRNTHELKKEDVTTDLCISRSVLLIDEAHTLFNSRNFKNFTRQCHEFFSLHRHLGNCIYLVTQHPARLDVVIREIASDFCYCSTFSLFGVPLWVVARYYYEDPCRSLSIDMDKELKPYKTVRKLYRKRIMMSYDTYYMDASSHTIVSADSLPLWRESAFDGVTVPESLDQKLNKLLMKIINCVVYFINRSMHFLNKNILRKLKKVFKK